MNCPLSQRRNLDSVLHLSQTKIRLTKWISGQEIFNLDLVLTSGT